jgi:hypothetical protein
VIYEVLDDIEHWLVPKLGRLITPREAPLPPPEHGAPDHEPIGVVARPPISVAE